ncbi:GlsB/YeaQ/YmgE family stress response membrane protein [Ralstonia insidiosa]|uniref:GlsB/YeaQ/YmgE family stress response membrane protein n=1 Tax=Ralstonia insidiosa TaxID=190721 RepID=A0A848P086_9RALS|nr:GlsB/YeaQ/YmgE family stress response membrane protein [Ralstonia insidiosa]NMV38593.1 GlsB/YeaQ/YmgE family stress response membrane protein [Ralstonia insidiosa]
MGWIAPLWIGLAVGAAAHWLYPGGKRLGWLAALLAGVIGALVGYYGGQFAHLYSDGQIMAWTAAVIGAMVVPAAWGLLRGGR